MADVCPVLLSYRDWIGGGTYSEGIVTRFIAAYEKYCAAYATVRGELACAVCAGFRDQCGPAGVGRFPRVDVDCAGVGTQDVSGCGVDGSDGVQAAVGGIDGARCLGEPKAGCAAGPSGVFVHDANSERGSDRDGRVFGDGFRGPTRAVGVVLGRGLPRGPNYARNQESRVRRRVRKQEEKNASQKTGFFSGCTQETQDKLRETRANLLIVENERRAIDEQRKVDRLKSPYATVKEAMEMVKFAEVCAKFKNGSKVAGWAETLSQAYATSVARSVPSTVPSFDDVTAELEKTKGNPEKLPVKIVDAPGAAQMSVEKRMQLRVTAATKFECAVLESGVLSASRLVEARVKAGRVLVYGDFTRNKAPQLSRLQEVKLRVAAGVAEERVMGPVVVGISRRDGEDAKSFYLRQQAFEATREKILGQR